MGALRRVPKTIVAAFIVVFVTASLAATVLIVHGSASCRERRTGWDNRHTAWVLLTEPTEFPPTADADRRAAEQAINDDLTAKRARLLAGLGERPNC